MRRAAPSRVRNPCAPGPHTQWRNRHRGPSRRHDGVRGSEDPPGTGVWWWGSGGPWRKQRRIALVAQQFLARHGRLDRPCRFDVVVVTAGETPRIEVYTNAF